MRKEHLVRRESAILGFGVVAAVLVTGIQFVPAAPSTQAVSSSTSTVKSSPATSSLSAPKISVASGEDD